MKTTFYSVTYRTWGMDSAKDKWFDNREDAYKFYNSADDDLRCDHPVAHSFSNPEKIEEAERIIEWQNEMERYYEELRNY